MFKKIFPTKRKLISWLKKTSCICLTSVALLSNVQTLEFNISHPKDLYTHMKNAPEVFPEGQYWVSYEKTDEQDDAVDYSKLTYAYAMDYVYLPRNQRIGGFKELYSLLHENFVVNSVVDRTMERTMEQVVSGHFWIVTPSSPVELQELKGLLESYTHYYAFNDGSNRFHENNLRVGNGTRNINPA
ncbi:hypothetical protein ACKBNH_004359 [Vibrio vulnificus]